MTKARSRVCVRSLADPGKIRGFPSKDLIEARFSIGLRCGEKGDEARIVLGRATVTRPAGATVLARLTTDARTARTVADMLAEALDPAETAIAAFETAGGTWILEVHFAKPPEEAAFRALVAAAANESAAHDIAFDVIAARDWVAASLEGLTPVSAGRFVVHGAHDRARVPLNRVGIEVEAALAFGTGHHGTTLGCLLAFDRLLRSSRPRHVLDVGTGTGVLAIAAARALRGMAMASDIDSRAADVARNNARINRVAPLVEIVQAPGLDAGFFRRRGPYELVFANILLAPLKRLARPMGRLLAPGAHVVLSGLLPEQANAALAAYRLCGLTLERRILLDGWVTLVLARRIARRQRALRRRRH